jgi:hypothetical protein
MPTQIVNSSVAAYSLLLRIINNSTQYKLKCWGFKGLWRRESNYCGSFDICSELSNITTYIPTRIIISYFFFFPLQHSYARNVITGFRAVLNIAHDNIILLLYHVSIFWRYNRCREYNNDIISYHTLYL